MIYYPVKYFLLLLLIFHSIVYGQSNKIRFEHITTDNGLSSNHISNILQDKKGFLWISTQDGINRFDGYNFKHFKHIPGNKNSLSDYAVSHIYEDSKGLLWISTRDGLNVFDPVKERFTHFKPKKDVPNSISTEKIVVTTEDKFGNIWIGTRKGLNLYNPTKKIFNVFLNNPSEKNSLSFNYVTKLFCDSKGNLWIGTKNGLNKFDYNTNSFNVYFHNPEDQKSISSNYISSFFEDSKGNLWIGTLNGLNKIVNQNENKIEFKSYVNIPGDYNSLSHNSVSSIVEDGNGNLWIGTIGGGVNVFDTKTNMFRSYQHNSDDTKSVSENNIASLHIDKNNNVWVGTFFKGINVYNPSIERFPLFQPNPFAKTEIDENNISSFLIDNQKNIWIATNGDGIKVYKQNTLFEKSTLLFELKADAGNINSLSSNNITSIIQDREAIIWIATFGGGLNRYDPITKKNKVFKHDIKNQNSIGNNFVHIVYEDSKGNIWLGTGLGGLNKFDKKTNSFKRYSDNPKYSNHNKYLNSPEVTAICEDDDGYLWIGTTTGGLSKFDPITESFIHFKHNQDDFESISSNRIISIYSDKKENIWIGTFSGGLNLYNNKTNSFTYFIEKDGLPSNNVQAITEDDEGNIWLTTSNGISKFDPVKKYFRNFDITDGLQGKEFNPNSIFKDTESGEIYFGGFNGLNIYKANSINKIKKSTNVVITDFKIFNKSVSVGDNSYLLESAPFVTEINLPHDQNVITLEFASLDFTSTHKNNYAYMLDGFNKDWIYCGSKHEATYTNLNPGNYVFKVKGTNSDGLWNENWSKININVSPPYWKTWWAYSMYLLLFLTAFYALRKYELNRVKLKNELKLKEFESKKLFEVNQIKSRFFANISHEFRTPLSIIIGTINNIKSKMENTTSEKDFTLLERNAARLLQLINQLLELSKIESGIIKLNAEYDDLVKYLKKIIASFSSLAYQKNLHLTFNEKTLEDILPMGEIFLFYDKKKMETVFYNLLSNAIKFSPKGEMIDVSISKNDKNVVIRFINTGIEISSESLPLIFDRFYQADSSETRNYEGTGIGLSLVKEYIELHNGKIEVESKNNKTIFTIYLPLEKIDVEKNESISEADNNSYPLIENIKIQNAIVSNPSLEYEQNSNEDKTIVLLVEDNSDLREMIKEILIDSYFVLEAENGVIGLKLAEQEIPDLIISDVMMPKMDGYEFSRKLKMNDKTNHIPIIMLTAKAATEDKLEGLETGVDDYLIKPFNPDELIIRVKNLIKIRKQMREKFQSQMLIKPSDVVVQSTQKIFLDKLSLMIENNISNENFSVEILCDEIGMSRAQLHRKIKALTNQSTSEFIRNFRLQRAAELLKQDAGNIAEIAYRVGFNSQAYFTKTFQEVYKLTPLEYKKQYSK